MCRGDDGESLWILARGRGGDGGRGLGTPVDAKTPMNYGSAEWTRHRPTITWQRHIERELDFYRRGERPYLKLMTCAITATRRLAWGATGRRREGVFGEADEEVLWGRSGGGKGGRDPVAKPRARRRCKWRRDNGSVVAVVHVVVMAMLVMMPGRAMTPAITTAMNSSLGSSG